MKNTQLQTRGNSEFGDPKKLNLVSAQNNWLSISTPSANIASRNQDIIECDYYIKDEQSIVSIPNILFGLFFAVGLCLILLGLSSIKPVNNTEYVIAHNRPNYESKRASSPLDVPESLVVYDNHGTITYNY